MQASMVKKRMMIMMIVGIMTAVVVTADLYNDSNNSPLLGGCVTKHKVMSITSYICT